MQYDQIRYVLEEQDPSITIETRDLIIKIIDNTGLLLTPTPDVKAFLSRYGTNSLTPYSHHLGYHGIRTLYNKDEKRNVVVPLVSWLNLQSVSLAGIENDPVDERAWSGVARGWPIQLQRKGPGAILSLAPMPKTQFTYNIEFQPVEPDGIEFFIRFVFHKRPDTGPVRFRASWPCYMNAYDDVRFFYPKVAGSKRWEWASLGEKPDIVIGEPVAYQHRQTAYHVDNQAIPVGFGRIGDRTLTLMFNDPRVRFFVVNAGGHFPISAIQNPAWDFEWAIDDYPLNEPVGFAGRLLYNSLQTEEEVAKAYRQWMTNPCEPVNPGCCASLPA